jgi:hypothetical protein
MIFLLNLFYLFAGDVSPEDLNRMLSTGAADDHRKGIAARTSRAAAN